MSRTEKHSRPWVEGYNAPEGSACPYSRGMFSYEEWQEGFSQGHTTPEKEPVNVS